MNSVLSIILCVLVGTGSLAAQKEILEFTLSKPVGGIQINLIDTVFHLGEDNPFQVVSIGDEPIVRVEVFRGKSYYNPMGWYEANFMNPGPTLIKVFAKNSKGETYLAHTRAVTVLPLPNPDIYICGVKNDSALNIAHLIKDRKITARMKNPSQYDFHPAVLEFSFALYNDTIAVKGNEIPFNYKSKLYELKDGGTFSVFDVKVMLPNSNKNIVVIPQASVFLINTDQYSVGTRNHIGN